MTDGSARGASVISSLFSCPLGGTIEFRPYIRVRSSVLNGAPFCRHSEPNCEPRLNQLLFAAAAFDRREITHARQSGIALRMTPRVVDSESCSGGQI
jgi:hypothetical protein